MRDLCDAVLVLTEKCIIFKMKTKQLDLYADYLISTTSYSTAMGLSTMLDKEFSHNFIRVSLYYSNAA